MNEDPRPTHDPETGELLDTEPADTGERLEDPAGDVEDLDHVGDETGELPRAERPDDED
jgi:hypothetical protein